MLRSAKLNILWQTRVRCIFLAIAIVVFRFYRHTYTDTVHKIPHVCTITNDCSKCVCVCVCACVVDTHRRLAHVRCLKPCVRTHVHNQIKP